MFTNAFLYVTTILELNVMFVRYAYTLIIQYI